MNKKKFSPIEITLSCPQESALHSLQLWCLLAGHHHRNDHQLYNRRINEFVLIYCVGGSGWFQLDKQRYDINAGDMLFCPANLRHSYGCNREGWDIWWTHCNGNQVSHLCHAIGLTAGNPVRDIGIQPTLVHRFSALVDSLQKQSVATPWDAADNLYRIFTCLIRCCTKQLQGQSLAELAIAGCNSLDELVAKSGMSKYHFCRLFRAETGCSPWQYVLGRKVERGKELLIGSGFSIKEIASQLGFANPDYFAKLFAKHTGVTPSSYRGGVYLSDEMADQHADAKD
jgi:AraC-like DNA-binding protein